MPKQVKNRVIIRVWHSALNKVQKGDNVGHVSIEIPAIKVPNPKYDKDDPDSKKKISFYCSFWPGSPSRGGITKFFEKREPHYMGGYESDQEAEKGGNHKEGKPETIICLYSLDIEKIFDEFKKTKGKVDGWTLFGSNRFINAGSKESCASFAYRLLNKGGIYDLVSGKYSSKFSLTATPDDMAVLVKEAKQKELRDYPETQGYQFTGELKMMPLPENKSCLVM